jgi:hypothetical protein
MILSDRTAARRALIWGLVAIVLVLTAVAGFMSVRGASGLVGRVTGPPAPPRITQAIVVERLQTVAKLVASEMTLRDVVSYQQTRFGSTKRALLVVTGRVSAGIDLEHGSDVSIDSATRIITVTLPPAQVLGVDVLDVTTYDERAGLLNPFRPEDRDAMHRLVREKLVSAARESGILVHADRSADRALTVLLTQDGYTVKIVRPMVVKQPTG